MVWLIAGVRQRRHRSVLERLEAFEVETFAPTGRMERFVKYQKDALIIATYPFGSYIFARPEVLIVRDRIDDMSCLFYLDGTPKTVSDGEIDLLKEAQANGEYDKLTPKARDIFKPGVKVTVVRGALRGMSGRVLRVSRRGKTATVEISSRPVDLAIDFVAPLT